MGYGLFQALELVVGTKGGAGGSKIVFASRQRDKHEEKRCEQGRNIFHEEFVSASGNSFATLVEMRQKIKVCIAKCGGMEETMRYLCKYGKLLSNTLAPNDIELTVFTDHEWDDIINIGELDSGDLPDQLDAIRVQLYEQSKDLSRENFVKGMNGMNERGRVIAERFGMTVVKAAADVKRPEKVAL
jgi:hypothetical protein